jgi:DNA-binding response OmpR family regulator
MSTTPPRILVVDDHPNTASTLARALTKIETPIEVLTASSAEEALTLIEAGTIEILITDFLMTGMSGLDLIEKLNGEKRPAYTILITAYDTPGLALSAKHLKVNNYLVKPVQTEKIFEIVSNALADLYPPESNTPSTESEPKFHPKILIADDNPDNIRLLSVRLQNEGYLFISAQDGIETLAKVRAELPDMVLLDINMPKKDGFEVLSELRSDPEIAHIPVIAITAARIGSQDICVGLNFGADDYVTKPINWQELAARIRTKLRVKQANDTLREDNLQLQKEFERKRRQELSSINQISRGFTDITDTDQLMKRAPDIIQGLLKYPLVTSWKVEATENSQKSLQLIQTAGDSQEVQVESLSPAPDRAAQFGSTICLPKTAGKTGALAGNSDIIFEQNQKPERRNYPTVAVPIRSNNKIFGLIAIHNPGGSLFRDSDIKILEILGNQLSCVIERNELRASA